MLGPLSLLRIQPIHLLRTYLLWIPPLILLHLTDILREFGNPLFNGFGASQPVCKPPLVL
jgi:hypothetical protein